MLNSIGEREWREQSIESTGANGTARSQTALKSETHTSPESGKGRGRMSSSKICSQKKAVKTPAAQNVHETKKW